MTQVVAEGDRTRTSAPLSAVPPATAGRPSPGPEPHELRLLWRVLAAVSALFALVLLFGVYLYGLSSVSEQRRQATLYKTLRHELAQAVAPIAVTGEGKPMAVLNMPSIGAHDLVVVEGTSSRDLMNGPGHRADTVYPGQAGVSVIYGKISTFGAPFASLMRLQAGDIISVTTGQGLARYRVTSFGDAQHPVPAHGANRLVLATADSATIPHRAVMVSADLISAVEPSGGPTAAISANEKGMAGDPGQSLFALVLWSQALLVLAVVGTFAAYRWARWPAFLCTVPLLIPVLWNVFENLAGVLPNLY